MTPSSADLSGDPIRHIAVWVDDDPSRDALAERSGSRAARRRRCARR